MKKKHFNLKEVAEILAKSMYKSVHKAMKMKGPIEDVLDPNFKPEAPAALNAIPKTGVMYKKDGEEKEVKDNTNKNSKLQEFLNKKKNKK